MWTVFYSLLVVAVLVINSKRFFEFRSDLTLALIDNLLQSIFIWLIQFISKVVDEVLIWNIISFSCFNLQITLEHRVQRVARGIVLEIVLGVTASFILPW
jgi:ABC-type iron transport system FetAB permease component